MVLPILHGPFGEDGTVQGLLELAGVPYVGAGVAASALCMDKDLFKAVLRDRGIPVARNVTLRDGDPVEHPFEYPVFVKPARLGSSVGISKVRDAGELGPAVDLARRHDDKVLIEEGVSGVEVECGVLGNRDPIPSVVGEIVAHADWYDYSAKYDEGGMDLVIPARISPEADERVRELAVDSFVATECEGMARIDFFVRDDGEVVVNEINTIPGFTSTSVYAELFEAAGVPYAELLDRLIALALERHERRSRLSSYLRARLASPSSKAGDQKLGLGTVPFDTGGVLAKHGRERLFPGTEPVVELRVRGRQRTEHADAVAEDAGFQEKQAPLQRLVDHRLGELRCRLFRCRVTHELDRQHRSEPADVSNLWPTSLPVEHSRAERLTQQLGALHELLLLEDVEDGRCCSERDRVADERAANRTRVRVVHDRGPADDPGERETAADRLRKHEEVGLDVEVLHREHPPGPSKPRLHLVGDEDDPVLVTDPPQSGDELGGRGEEAPLPLLWLEDDRGDVVGRHVGREEPFERRERRLGIGSPVRVRERSPIHLRRERAQSCLVRVRPGRHRQRHPRSAVERSFEGNDALPLRVQPRELDRVLDRLGTRVEERATSLARDRHQLAEALRQLDVAFVGNHGVVGVQEAVDLLADRLDDPRVVVTDVGDADSADEVDERVAVDVGDRGAACSIRDDRLVDDQRAGHRAALALEDLAAARAGDLRPDLDHTGRRHARECIGPTGR